MISAFLSATEYIKEGRLSEALQAMQSEVRGNSDEAVPLVSLIQLLCVLGSWEDAAVELQVLDSFGPAHRSWRRIMTQALKGEKRRRDVFAGLGPPLVLGEPRPWVEPLIEALKPASPESQAVLRRKAYEAAPEVPVRIGGENLPWLADSDSRLGPVLEGIIDGNYCWVPLEQMRSLQLEAPCDLQHLVWSVAQVTWVSGGESSLLIPTRYPGSELMPDDRVRLARVTTWEDLGDGQSCGAGQRLFNAGDLCLPLLDLREIEFNQR